MRARGANVTDIIIIVVAADDGVKSSNRRSYFSCKSKWMSIIVTMNKMDKETQIQIW